MSNKFTVSEADVRKRDGDTYSIDLYREGEDYVSRKCFSSFKRVFRSDILGISVVDPSLVEHKQEPSAILELGEQGMKVVFAEPNPEDWRASVPECKEIEQQDEVKECKVKRLYPNQRWVETDRGRVFAGLKGTKLRVGQVIRVLNGQLVTKLANQTNSLVRI